MPTASAAVIQTKEGSGNRGFAGSFLQHGVASMQVFPGMSGDFDETQKSVVSNPDLKCTPSPRGDCPSLEVASRLREWAMNHHWDKAAACTHQLTFAKQFTEIQRIAWEKEMSGQTLLSGQIAYQSKRIHNFCGNIDRLVRQGCRTEEELEELESSKNKVKSALLELSTLVAACSEIRRKQKTFSKKEGVK